MKNRKIQFIRAVRVLAPHDTLVLQFAACVRPDDLPGNPGAAALEFVAAMQQLKAPALCPRRMRINHASHSQRTSGGFAE